MMVVVVVVFVVAPDGCELCINSEKTEERKKNFGMVRILAIARMTGTQRRNGKRFLLYERCPPSEDLKTKKSLAAIGEFLRNFKGNKKRNCHFFF